MNNPRPEAPDAGSAPDHGRIDLGSAKYDFGRKLNAIITVSSTWEDAAELAASLFAIPPARAAAAGDGAIDALLDKLVSCATRNGFYRHPTDPTAEGYIDEGVADARVDLRRAIAAHTDAAVSATLSASGSAPAAGTVTLEEMAKALAPIGSAVRAADYWAQMAPADTDNALRGHAWRDARGNKRMLTWGDLRRAAAILDRLSDANTSTPAQPVRIGYVNWRGEATTPTIVPTRLFWGSNEWHPEPCWLLEAMDIEKQALRTFDICKIRAADGGLGPAGAAAQGLREAADIVAKMAGGHQTGSAVQGLLRAVRKLREHAIASAEAGDGFRPIAPPAPASAVGESER